MIDSTSQYCNKHAVKNNQPYRRCSGATEIAELDIVGRPTDYRDLACYRCCRSVGKYNEKVII